MMDWNGRPLRSTRRVSNLLGARQRWYKIDNLAGTGPAVVSIYDEIGMFGVSAQDFVNELRGMSGRDIELHLNTPGGDVFDGIAIYNTLRQSKGQVSVIIDGLAASAGSFIAQAASPGRLEIAPHAQMMIHNGFAMAIGDAGDMRKTADLLDQVTAEIAGIYADRTGKPAAHWLALMAEETWLTDKMCVAEGLADRIHGQDGPQDKWDLSVYRNAAPPHGPTAGTHSHEGPGGEAAREHSHDGDADHAGVFDPDGDGDDDSSAGGDTDHDYVLPDGKPGPKARLRNAEKYSADDRKEMASKGHAMPDGSYPIADGEDLDNAIRAVGRGGSDHDAIRRHIIKRADALGQSSKVPDNWGADGSLKDLSDTEILAIFARELASPELEGSK
jgi:ATP-dependent Clp endopeptidase proteolytic subunit ClpP